MNGLQQRLIVIIHAAVITWLMVSLPNLSVQWAGVRGWPGFKHATKAIPDNIKVSHLDHLWQPLLTSLDWDRFSTKGFSWTNPSWIKKWQRMQ